MFRKEPKTTAYLYDTPIENIFLAEYMPEIPGDYLKVYLYAQMLASKGEPMESLSPQDAAEQAAQNDGQNGGSGIGLAEGSLASGYRRIAKALRMEPVDVEKAFLYLSELGLAEKRAGRWIFPEMKEKLFASSSARKRTAENGQTAGAGSGQPAGAGDTAAYRRLLNNGPIADMTAKI